MAMLARGFNGEFHTRRNSRFGGREILFVAGWSTLFIAMRILNMSQLLGSLVTGVLQ
jgi:cobalt/nickel transport system permease protein